MELPDWQGDQLYMHPIDLAQPAKLPEQLQRWEPFIGKMLLSSPTRTGTAYVTIDQREVQPNHTHRRGGPHVDGNFLFAWNGSGGGGSGWLTGEDGRVLPPELHKMQYCSDTGATLIASSYSACKGWVGDYDDEPAQGGNCAHFAEKLKSMASLLMKPFRLYLMGSTAIHESLPIQSDTPVRRTLLRITLPEHAQLGTPSAK